MFKAKLLSVIITIVTIGGLGFLTFIGGCNGLTVKNAEVKDLNWLEGKWRGHKNGTKLSSTWKKLTTQSLNGTTYLLNNMDTTGIRAFRIETTNGEIILNLKRSSEKPSVGYKLSKIGGKEATFKNSEARFPNTIHYQLKGENKLKAVWTGKTKGKETTNKYILEKAD
jgi:hypothetical protein